VDRCRDPGIWHVRGGHDRAVTDIEELRERHGSLLTRLRAVAEANGHDPMALLIVGVTKTHPVEVARAAVAAGIGRLGESRVQEAEPKIHAVPTAEWHLVGRLQSNKVRRAVGAFEVIHSVDAVGLLTQLERVAAEEGRHPRLLVQVNVTGEVAKGGMTPDELLAMAGDLGGRRVIGLMTIARMGASDEEARATFRRLRELRDRARDASGEPLEELSMGMSDDAEAAAAEGATLVRIGTALFGPRP
jgi:pyridoxal phosphate enzyme (YggS family)